MDTSPRMVDPRLLPFALNCRNIMCERTEDFDLMALIAQGCRQQADCQSWEAGKIVQIHDQDIELAGRDCAWDLLRASKISSRGAQGAHLALHMSQAAPGQ